MLPGIMVSMLYGNISEASDSRTTAVSQQEGSATKAVSKVVASRFMDMLRLVS